MQINKKDISTFSVELNDRKISTIPLTSNTEWGYSMVEGILVNQKQDFKTMELTFLVKGTNEQDALKNIGLLTNELKKCEIQFDDINYTFYCVLNSKQYPTRYKNARFKLTYILKIQSIQGEYKHYSFEVGNKNITKLNIKYIDNLASIIGSYVDGYLESEYFKEIATENVYIDNNAIAAAANNSNNWITFFLSLGIDINKYKPIAENTYNGVIDINEEYSSALAANIFNSRTNFSIYYNRFHKDGITDFPMNITFPSLTWDSQEEYCIPFTVNESANYANTSILLYGRPTASKSGTNKLVGTRSGNIFKMVLNKAMDMEFTIGTSTKIYPIINNKSSSSGGITITTVEDVSGLPLKKYSIESGSKDFKTYYYVNGASVGAFTKQTETALNNNWVIGEGCDNFEFSRIQIKVNDNIIHDFIPINGSLKNGFINNADNGFYDIISMKFYPWETFYEEPSYKPPGWTPPAIETGDAPAEIQEIPQKIKYPQ